jgi:hypothetical protein
VGSVEATFTDTCKVVLSLTSPFLLLYANTLKKISIHLGGAAAAAPEGGTLASPSASPHPPVVGAGNHVAVPCLARCGAKRAGSTIRAICSCRKNPCTEGFLKEINYVRHRRQDLPLGPSDMFFQD